MTVKETPERKGLVSSPKPPEFTSQQIIDGIFASLREGKPSVTESLLKLLAVHYPDEAQSLIDVVEKRNQGRV